MSARLTTSKQGPRRVKAAARALSVATNTSTFPAVEIAAAVEYAHAEKAAATRAKLYSPALTIGVALAAGLGFMIGRKRGHPLTLLVYAAAGYCGIEILRGARRAP